MRKLWPLEVSKRHKIKKKDFPDFGIIFVKEKDLLRHADVSPGEKNFGRIVFEKEKNGNSTRA